MKLLKIFEPKNPCETNCLVRSTCIIKKDLIIIAERRCEILKSYRDKLKKFKKIDDTIENTFYTIVSSIIVIVVVGIPVLGVWKFWELLGPFIKSFIKGLFS